MPDILFAPDPTRLMIASTVGIVVLLVLIIRCKLNPILSLLVSALLIGLGAGMPADLLAQTVEEGAGETLRGIVLLIGLGSMFGGILEVSGGAKSVAQTLINRFGEERAGIALGITGLVVGTTVFFEAGVMILMPLAFGLAKRTGRSTLYYAIPLLAGLATGFAFVPPSAGSVLVSNMLGVDLGLMILVGAPAGALSLLFAGVFWSKFVGRRIYVPAPIQNSKAEEEELPPFSTVLAIIFTPLVLILLSTLSSYVVLPRELEGVIRFLGTPFVALMVAIFQAIYLLEYRRGHTMEDVKSVLENALAPTANILLVITGGGIISQVLQTCGMGTLVGSALERSGLPLVLVAFLIAGLIRICVGAAVVSMTMTAGIMMSMPAVATLSPLYMAAMVLSINGGATAFSHFNDSGFWMVSSLLKMEEGETLKSWTMMETIIGLIGLGCALVISLFA